MYSIVISYRRQDSADETRRLYELFSTIFGKDRLFRDLDTVAPGSDFVEKIDRVVSDASIVLAVIGPDWASSKDPSGNPRLNNRHDYVRVEIARALANHKRLIPVFVRGAEMPGENDIPAELVPMLRRQAVTIRDEHFNSDLEKLSNIVKNYLDEHPDETAPQALAEAAANADKVREELSGIKKVKQQLERELSNAVEKQTRSQRHAKWAVSIGIIMVLLAGLTVVVAKILYFRKDHITLIATPELLWHSELPRLERKLTSELRGEISARCAAIWEQDADTQIWHEPGLFIPCTDEIRTIFEEIVRNIENDIETCEANLDLLMHDSQPAAEIKLGKLYYSNNVPILGSGFCYSDLPVREVKETPQFEQVLGLWIDILLKAKNEAGSVLQAIKDSKLMPRFPVWISNRGSESPRLSQKAVLWLDEDTMPMVAGNGEVKLAAGETRKVIFDVDMKHPGVHNLVNRLMDKALPLDLTLGLNFSDMERRVPARLSSEGLDVTDSHDVSEGRRKFHAME